jgi:hypothetical protein
MSVNLFGPDYKKRKLAQLKKSNEGTELTEFKASSNTDKHPKITITAGPNTTSRAEARGLKRKTKRHHKKHHKKSKKHHKKNQNKRTQKRQ